MQTSPPATTPARTGVESPTMENGLNSALALPTFIGIGSMRCGSTWLYEALKRRPDVHMTTPKQLQFFNRRILRRDLAWYASHFEPLESESSIRAQGEITPFYSRLSDASVANVHRLVPDAKIVLTIRNPIERVWSHILYDWGVCKKKDVTRLSTLGLMNFLQRQRTIRYTDYEAILRRWRRCFGDRAVHVDVFDRIKSDSTGFLRDVLTHIGADPNATPVSDEPLDKPVYAAQSLLKKTLPAPPAIHWALATQWLPPVRRLNDFLSGRVTGWIEEMEAIASESKPSWRAMREASRYVTSIPERIAYAAYDRRIEHALQKRWKGILDEAAR